MTELDLNKLREIAEAATPGPWKFATAPAEGSGEVERLRGVIEKVRELAEDSEPQCCGPVLGDPLGEA